MNLVGAAWSEIPMGHNVCIVNDLEQGYASADPGTWISANSTSTLQATFSNEF